MKHLRVALVYDRINKFGGAERVLQALHEIWPDAPIYTAVYDPVRSPWARTLQIIPSFLQNVPFAKIHHEWFAWATQMAFESFNFDGYDVVLSVTSAEAKAVITKPGTLHICYCLTPTRYLWMPEDYSGSTNIGLPEWLSRPVLSVLSGMLRKWDMVASARPDYYVAISRTVAGRIGRYYKCTVRSVLYPPVDIPVSKGAKQSGNNSDKGYYLAVSRLVAHKRLDIVIDAFNRLGWPLIIVGDGVERTRLERRAGNTVRFTGTVSDTVLHTFFAGCTAFVSAGREDFGIAAVEALAAGRPVIAYKESGPGEFVIPGKTGELYPELSAVSLSGTLKTSEGQWYDSQLCREKAVQFSVGRFKREMKHTVQTLYNTLI